MTEQNPASFTHPYASAATPARPRIWVGLILVALQFLAINVPQWVVPGTMVAFQAMIMAPVVCGLIILVWWMAFSRFPGPIRVLGLASFLLCGAIGYVASDVSMKVGVIGFALPIATTLLVVVAVAGNFLGKGFLRVGLVAAPLLVFGFFATLRLDGLFGNIHTQTSFRWTPTREELYLRQRQAEGQTEHHAVALLPATQPDLSAGTPAATRPSGSSAAAAPFTRDWPGFRGSNRDGVLAGQTIRTDWTSRPPRQLWRHPIGPGWSSFCVIGDYVFTQEQLGPSERVTCYSAVTGDEVWSHDDAERFDEPIAGPGPRATPTFADGRLYTFGARGRLNCLSPSTGAVIWTHDVAADSGAALPMWGFSASPLVWHGLVTVISGADGKAVMAYDAATGQPRWSTGDGWSYASTQVSTIDGVEQLLAVSNNGLLSLNPETGAHLWEHSFVMPGSSNRIVQPAVITQNDVLLGAAFGVGTRKIHVTHDASGWHTQSLWTSRSLKPYYNDMVSYQGNIYGFDGDHLTCVNPDDGSRRWRQDGYGNGQVLLLADQGVLLVLSEHGEAALVQARPDGFNELGKFQALDAKTWNHPVIASGKLFVRNGEEIACYDLK